MKPHIHFMKRYFFLLILVGFFSGCEHTNADNMVIEKYEKEIQKLQEEIKELKDQLGNQNSNKPKNLISPEFARKIFQEYNKREELINEVVGTDGVGERFMATRSLFYDIDELQNYIRYVKRMSQKAKVEPTGFNFYFALYPEDYEREDKLYAKRQTFFIAPTLEKGKKQLGYTLDDNFNVVLLGEAIGNPYEGGKSGKKQKAGFFSFSSALPAFENSLISNEIAGTPPMNKL